MSELDIDDFLGHRTGGGGGTMLGRWKDNDPPQVDTVLHRKSKIVCVWRHRVPMLEDVTDFKTKAQLNKVVSSSLVCWEPESVLKEQYKRDDDGCRKNPPCSCGLCRFVDWIRMEVVEGRLHWLEPIFDMQGDDDDERTVVRAAHIYNGFSGGKDKFEDEQLKEMKEAKVYFKTAWSLNYFAKAQYIFRVVDIAHPEKGVGVSIEPALLGDKVKSCIAEMREKHGMDDGNPMKNPYVIRWKFFEKEQEFNKKYKALAMDNIPITEAVMRLITETDAPDVDHLTQKFNAAIWRTKMENECKIDVPWEDLFAKSEGQEDLQAAQLQRASKPAQLTTKAAPSAAKPVPPKAALKAKSEPEKDSSGSSDAQDEEEFDCDACGKPLKATDKVCPHKGCGHVYEVEEAAKPEPEPAPVRKKRSEVKAEQQAAKPASKPAPAATPPRATTAPRGAARAPQAARRGQPEIIDTTGEEVKGEDDDIPF